MTTAQKITAVFDDSGKHREIRDCVTLALAVDHKGLTAHDVAAAFEGRLEDTRKLAALEAWLEEHLP